MGYVETMTGDLEDGEIEDGEIPDEEIVSGGEVLVKSEPEKSVVPRKSEPTLLPPQNDTASPEEKPQVSSSKLKRPVPNRGAVNQRHVDSLKENTVEDDWAGDVEKAIKAAMSSTDNGQELNTEVNENGGDIAKAEDDDERKSRRKKRKKKHREDDEERKEVKKRKRSHGCSKETVAEETMMDVGQVATSDPDEEDDDEMLFVRGASPIMRSGYSPPAQGFHDEPFGYMDPGGPFEDPYDSYCDDSDYEREEFVRSRRGDEEGPKRGGRGGKRRQQGRGGVRGIQNKRQQGGRKDAAGSKGKRMGNKRQQQRTAMLLQDPRQGPDSICMFYMQGKCQKGDECPYSHDALPPRKMELCKFYLMDCCAKKDKCLYMHSDFPCKFYHTGLKCFAGDRCKFSHGTLTESLRAVLLKHLETAPKEILGDFPRLSREGAAAMVYNKKNRGNKGTGPGNKKIPSLFEIEVPIPAQLLAGNLHGDEERSPARRTTPMPDSDNEDQDGCRTPMPSSPKLETHSITKDFSSRASNRNWDADKVPGNSGDEEIRHPRMFDNGMDVSRDPSEAKELTRRSVASYQDRDFTEQLQQLKMRFYQETVNSADEVGANKEVRHQRRHRHRHGKNKTTTDTEQQTRIKQNLHYLAGYSHSPATEADSGGSPSQQGGSSAGVEAVELADDEGKLEIVDQHEDDDNEEDVDGGKTPPVCSTAVQDGNKKDQLDTDHNSSCSTETGGLPHNLPKKQRELFLRIQQQQREAAESSSHDQSGEDDGKDEDVEQQQEENWYSSDEEEASLADVLKNLSKQQQHSTSPPRASTTPPLPAPAGTPSLDSIKLSAIDISEPVSKLLSSLRHQQSTSAVSVIQAAENSDSRTSTQSHLAVVPTTQARDPRLVSRDPRNRSATATTSMSLLSPSTFDSSHHDARTSKRADSSEEKSELRHTSIYSSAITSSAASTNMTHGHLESGGDVDLRNFHSRQLQPSAGFESGTDVDLRQNLLMRASTSSSSFNYGDTDLRGTSGDVDLRGMLGLPFKPVPMHTPATEIDASLTSHPPIPYKVVSITVPRPDYSGLKLNTLDPQVRNDPRLRKLFKMSSNSVDSPASPPLPPPPLSALPLKQSPSAGTRSDPRRRSAPLTPHSSSVTRLQDVTPVYSELMSQNPMSLLHSTGIPTGIVPSLPAALSYDPRLPRNPRNAPGILGPAPLPLNYCPNTPRFEDVEEGNSNGSDTDLRMFYGNSAPTWEQQLPQAPSQHPHRNRNWRNSRRNQQRYHSQQQEQQRSFTPPL
ncbi:uncharacterized protein LOC111870443 isoform X4 [Cryptotermes secundus]|uniref:uncharacterized protein LOC111870443 isoform X4 n=1 Tax=Cryptotermes secundus TaxID=105785 RepID=UPI000CD7CC36|nr:uncharacterized protein LOC111870443 isoform X4 [Cryptotermes secundus]